MFEQAHEAMDKALETESPTTPTDAGLAPESTPNPLTAKVSEIPDISSMAKFKFKDQELTPQELEKAFLRQKDYTKKTQEHAQAVKQWEADNKVQFDTLKQENQFYANLKADLEHVKRDPSLAQKFLEIYPAKFHHELDNILGNTSQTTQNPQQPQRPFVDPSLLRSVHELKSRLDSREQLEKQSQFDADSKTKEAQLDAADAKFSKEFKWANPETVLAKFSYLNDKGTFGKPTDQGYMDKVVQAYQQCWKQDHEANLKRYEEFKKEQLREQKQANSKGKDMGTGGGTPSQAPAKMKLKDVKNHIISTMGN